MSQKMTSAATATATMSRPSVDSAYLLAVVWVVHTTFVYKDCTLRMSLPWKKVCVPPPPLPSVATFVYLLCINGVCNSNSNL